MERETKELEETIKHFSHPHILKLSNFQAQNDMKTHAITCSACKLKAFDWIYSCETCEFFLHAKCSNMPKQITHPCHKEHVLNLLSAPLNATASFTCNACSKSCDDGLFYNCVDCKCNLHMLCAVLPRSRSHNAHPHELKLTFDIPNSHVYFQCDICKETSYNQWFYWCSLCDFSIHPCCINKKAVIAPTTSRQIAKSQSSSQLEPFFANTPITPPRVNSPWIQRPSASMTTRPLSPSPMYSSRYTQPLNPSPMYPARYPIPQPMHFMQQTMQDHQRMVLQQAIQNLTRANSIQNRVAINMLQSMVEGAGNGAMQSLMQPSGGQDMLQGLLGGGDFTIPGLDGFGGFDGLLGGLGGFF